MKILLIVSLLCISQLLTAADYREQRDLNLPSENVELLEINCGAGFLKVSGAGGNKEITVKAEIEVTGLDAKEANEILEKELRLSLEKRGNRAILTSEVDDNASSLFSLFKKNGRITVNLTVRVPENFDLRVDDGSGFIEIENIGGSLRLDDGSGDISLLNIAGEVYVDDGSGNLLIDRAGADVEVEDGSGDLRIENVRGDVRVDDGSGSIRIRKIDGSVSIDDGSGSIEIEDVKKDVDILDDGSGGVEISHVQGNIFRHDK